MTEAEGAGGRFFTPAAAAREVVERLDLRAEAAFDPTCGAGALLAALAAHQPDCRLIGWDVHRPSLDLARQTLADHPAVELQPADFLLAPSADLPQVPLIFGNPPWLGFADLPPAYKTALKPLFVHYGLTGSRRSLLLGGSRIDVAALVIARALTDCLHPGGLAVFFAPLSLVAPGAHQFFQDRYCHGSAFRLRELWDWGERPPFPQVGTAHGLLVWERAPFSDQPVRRCRWTAAGWQDEATPVATPARWAPIALPPQTRPRQGLNAGGAHAVFVFDSQAARSTDAPEAALLHPLLDRSTLAAWRQGQTPPPTQWAFLPYDPSTGRLWEPAVLAARFPRAWAYLLRHRLPLEARRGVLMASQRRRGAWYGLLGVGPYTFRPWKIVWEAYGKQRFEPALIGPQVWIPNQALQCSLDFDTEDAARAVLDQLNQLPVTAVLTALGGAGKPSWAQPGRMRQFFRLADTDQ